MTWSTELIAKVWEKADVAAWYPLDRIRKDQFGDLIKLSDFGDYSSEYGWEISYIDPGKGDDISNLEPLQWKNCVFNRKSKGKSEIMMIR